MPKSKCAFKNCNKKLSLIDNELICRCKKIFCSTHRFTIDHKCDFDFKKIEPSLNINKLIFHNIDRNNSMAF